MDQIEQDIRNGERAQYAMEYLLEKFARIEADIAELLWEVNMHDQATKDELLRTVKNLRKLRAAMEQDINNANLARELVKRSAGDRLRSVVGF
jgi:hypothetical protein